MSHELSVLCVNDYQGTDQENSARLSDVLLSRLQTNRSLNAQALTRNFLEYPTDIVLLVVLWRLRYRTLVCVIWPRCLRERGFAFTHEAVRDWEARLVVLQE